MGDRKAYTVFHLGYGKDGLDVKRRKEEPIGTLKVIALWEKWKWLKKKKKDKKFCLFHSHFMQQFFLDWQTCPAQLWSDSMNSLSW